jgi:hypothetical protein
MDQRKKGDKPPFFRNNPQGQQTPREPRMIETGGQRPRKPPIQCWGCKGDHMYRDFPHRGEKVRTIHNVQQAETMEDMGRNVPRIYAALDNKQAEYQLLELLHTHLGFLFPKFISCLLFIISHYPVSYILGEHIPPGEYSLSVDTSV